MEERYPALTFIAQAFRFIAVIVGITGIVLSFWLSFQTPTSSLLHFMSIPPISSAFVGTVASLVIALPLYALGDFYLCIITSEYNTRPNTDEE